MIAYHVFEVLVVAGFLLFSLRQVLRTVPKAAAGVARLARQAGLPERLCAWIAPPAKAGGCSACDSCSGCGPTKTLQDDVITLHRSTKG